MLSVSKPTLVELKKQQWAREREEMSHLYLPWGSGERYNKNQFASNLELHKQTYEYQEPIQRQRSPSLPPIHQLEPERQENRDRVREILNRNLSSAKRFAFYDEDGEGDTSGYGSETINHMNKRNSLNESLDGRTNPVLAWQQDKTDKNGLASTDISGNNTWISRSPRSSTDEGRLRWGDRGVATGRLWEPTTPNDRLPQMPNQKKGTPSWVERGLNMIENSCEVLVIDQSSTNSGHECDRSSCNGSEEGRTFLRGQNVPLEPEVKALRENKRIKAMELQSAILSQLEDREKRRQEEREMKLREERLEELRLQRQQEQDRLRLEEEKRKNEERMAMEQRKLETLKKALEDAERKAREDKEKRFNSHKQTRNINCQIQDSIEMKPKLEDTFTNLSSDIPEAASPTKSNRTYSLHSAKSQKKEGNSQHPTEFSSPRSGVGSNNLNLYIHSVPPLSLNENQYNLVPIGINGEIINGPPNSVQLAVLVPQNIQNLCNLSLNSLNITDTEKILTPSKYRTLRMKHASTQTDVITSSKLTETENLHRDLDNNYAHIDENAPHDSNYNTLKKDRRFRSEERYKKELENRPKWGVNRPAAQYKKQSEKDPFYSQKRKLRQKYRPQQRQYLSQSSEDSRSPSPPVRPDKNIENNILGKHRNSISQSYWRKKISSQEVSKNSSEINNAFEYNQSEASPNFNVEIGNKSPKMSPTKRLTLSQKFINDKYGNKKLWIEDTNEKGSNSLVLDGENRKKIIEQLNVAKRDFLNRNNE